MNVPLKLTVCVTPIEVYSNYFNNVESWRIIRLSSNDVIDMFFIIRDYCILYDLFVRYIQVEWDLKKAPVEGARSFEKSSMKGASPGCPQQLNSSDCGIYLLSYIENFFKVGL
jgi:hypothetical protein